VREGDVDVKRPVFFHHFDRLLDRTARIHEIVNDHYIPPFHITDERQRLAPQVVTKPPLLHECEGHSELVGIFAPAFGEA
jgi:hypothetical protein